MKPHTTAVSLLVFRFIIDGLESSVIIPTIKVYLNNDFNTTAEFVGPVMAAYGIGGLLSGFTLGRLSDLTQRPDFIIVFCSILSAFGNFLYALASNKNYLVLARFISGFNTNAICIGGHFNPTF